MALWLGANQGTLKGDPGPSQACSGHFSTAWLTAKRPAEMVFLRLMPSGMWAGAWGVGTLSADSACRGKS